MKGRLPVNNVFQQHARLTKIMQNLFLRLFVLCFIIFSFTACAQKPEDTARHELTQLPTNSWPTNGGNIYNQRFSPLEQISPDNIGNLKGVWRVHLNGSGLGPQYSGEAQPIVQDGVAYVITGADDVFALSIETGEILWQYTAGLPETMTTVCCGWTSRGVGLGDGRIYVGQLDGQLKALDQNTGEVLWATQAERWQEGYTITSAPLYHDGMVVIGFAGSELGTRGRIKAFDAKDGSLIWTFYTIPEPGEFGHDTWPQDHFSWRHGGASIWSTPAVDPALGLLYFATGNSSANSNGSLRAGDNLFTASIMALDIKTGEYRWHFQEVHHDIWDYDASNPVILFDIELDGTERKAITQAGKTGWFYILDRITGEPLIGIEEKPVPQDTRQATAATQPYPVGDAFVPQSMRIAPEGYGFENQAKIFTPYWTDPLPIAPGAGGGANWPPSAYDPNKGYAYVCAADRPFLFSGLEIPDVEPESGQSSAAGVFLGEALYSFGVYAAVDMRTNKLVWQRHTSEPCFSGMTATAAGLIFTGRSDGRLLALDSNDGRELWEFQTGAGMNSPVSIFEHKGTQYVIAYSAGNVLAGSKKGDSVWLFSLDGTLNQTDLNEESNTSKIDFEVAEGEADLAAGQRVFETACLACHGKNGKGGHGGGADLSASSDFDSAVSIIAQGKNNMPAMAAVLTSEQLRDVTGYVSLVLAK